MGLCISSAAAQLNTCFSHKLFHAQARPLRTVAWLFEVVLKLYLERHTHVTAARHGRSCTSHPNHSISHPRSPSTMVSQVIIYPTIVPWDPTYLLVHDIASVSFDTRPVPWFIGLGLRLFFSTLVFGRVKSRALQARTVRSCGRCRLFMQKKQVSATNAAGSG